MRKLFLLITLCIASTAFSKEYECGKHFGGDGGTYEY